MSSWVERRFAAIEAYVGELAISLQDAHRRLANIVRIGRVVDTDPAKYLVKVAWGKNSDNEWVEGVWMPWTTRAASDNKDWNPPSVGEQVTIFSPSGHIGIDSWAMPGGFSGEIVPNGNANGTRKINVGENTELLMTGDAMVLRTKTFTIQADQIHLRGQRIDHNQQPLAEDPPTPDLGDPPSGEVPTS